MGSAVQPARSKEAQESPAPAGVRPEEQARSTPAYTPAQAPSTEREYPTLGYE